MPTYDSVYRDTAAAHPYPLDASATQTTLDNELLLDMSLYLPSTLTPGFFVRSVDGGIVGGGVRLVIADASYKTVCYADCSLSAESAIMYNNEQGAVGAVVYDTDRMSELHGKLEGTFIQFTPQSAPLASEVVRFYTQQGVLGADCEGPRLLNCIRLSMANGVHYATDGSGEVSMYGEVSETDAPIKSVNSMEVSHVFILSKVFDNYTDESALRIETTGSEIRVGQSSDF